MGDPLSPESMARTSVVANSKAARIRCTLKSFFIRGLLRDALVDKVMMLPAAPITYLPISNTMQRNPKYTQKCVEEVFSARNRPTTTLKRCPRQKKPTRARPPNSEGLVPCPAVTPPCRCRPVPTRQKVRWDHLMPPRPTCAACRCRLLLATRLFQISHRRARKAFPSLLPHCSGCSSLPKTLRGKRLKSRI